MTANQLVALSLPFEGLPAGARGRVIGVVRRTADEFAFIVSFAGHVAAVPAGLLAAVDDG